MFSTLLCHSHENVSTAFVVKLPRADSVNAGNYCNHWKPAGPGPDRAWFTQYMKLKRTADLQWTQCFHWCANGDCLKLRLPISVENTSL